MPFKRCSRGLRIFGVQGPLHFPDSLTDGIPVKLVHLYAFGGRYHGQPSSAERPAAGLFRRHILE